MLKSILSDTRFFNKNCFHIILLPPPTTAVLSTENSSHFNYLSSHVVQIPNDESIVDANHKKFKKLKQHMEPEKQLISINETIYKISHGQVIYRVNKKAKILNSRLLYPTDKLTPTHLILYLNKHLIDQRLIQEVQKPKNVNDLRFKELIQRNLPIKNSNEILFKIDELVMKFSDESVYCESLDGLHDCIKKILIEGHQLIEKNMDVSTINKIYSEFESYIMDLTYDVAFFKITQLLLDQDKKLSVALDSMEHLDFSQIGLPSSIKDERKRVSLAIREFEKIGSFRTPIEKLDCLLNTIRILSRHQLLDSDALIPLLLMTLIKSKVPHLTANLIYIKEYNFERNIITGKFGYALSTFEGVLDYIMNESPELSKLSSQNFNFWSNIKNGHLDINHESLLTRDTEGNNALMIACIYGQLDLVNLLLKSPDNSTNDLGKTPLMCAIQHQHLDIIRLLLKDSGVQHSINQASDQYGNTAVLYASRTNQVEILEILLEHSSADIHQVNTFTQDSVLHIAVKNICSLDFIKYILNKLDSLNVKNKKGELLYHVCESLDVLKYLLKKPSVLEDILYQKDNQGYTPLFTWASKGRLDLIELLVPYIDSYNVVDHEGNTILHMLALHLTRHFTFGKYDLDYIVEKFQKNINTKEWIYGNSPLHIVAETSTHLYKSNAILFAKALIKHGAVLNTANFKDEYSINICRLPELISCIEEMSLSMIPRTKQGLYKYSWTVTRTYIEQNKADSRSKIFYIVKSGEIGKPDSIKTVKRSIQDFILLRKELLFEMPEIFLPTFKNMLNPELIDLHPPPFTLIHENLERLRHFINYLMYHPVLQRHDLVISFIRSTAELQLSCDYSISRRKLFLEKIPDSHQLNTKDEIYFLKYIEELMKPLKKHFRELLLTSRRMRQIGLDLEDEMKFIQQQLDTSSSDMFTSNLIALKTLTVCSCITFEKSFVSPSSSFSNTIFFSYTMIDGILSSLQRPYSLIKERDNLREKIEEQKEVLRKSKHWQQIFTPKKRLIDGDKHKVLEGMNELNQIDNQISQSHKMISDELAHFQTIHPKQMIKSIRKFVRISLESERYKLNILSQTLNEWQ